MKSLGLFSVVTLVASLIYAQVQWGPDYRKTFSRLVAQKRSSIMYYFGVFFIFLSNFSVFMVTSFIPQFSLPKLFVWIYFLGVASQFICVAVPEVGGNRTKVHLIAAGVMSISALAQLAALIFLTHLSLLSFAVCLLSLLIMSVILLVVVLKHSLTKYELGLQSIYFASYLGALIFISYVG